MQFVGHHVCRINSWYDWKKDLFEISDAIYTICFFRVSGGGLLQIKRVRASYTIENSYLLPMFTIIIIILIMITFYFHDMAIIKNVLVQTAANAEQHGELSEEEIENLCKVSAAEIKNRTVFTKKIKVNLENDKNKYTAGCTAEFMGAGVVKVLKKIEKNQKISICYPPDFIRKVRAVEKVIPSDIK